MSSLILVSSVAGAVLAISGIIWCISHAYGARHAPSRRVYADAESVTLQEESAFGDAPSAQVGAGRGDNDAAYTPAYNSGQRPSQNLRDNYADRDAIDYRREGNNNYYGLDGGVRPASPNAERVEGIPIEARVRPRRNLPRNRIVVHHGGQDVCLDFRGVERVPKAGPPPLTLEEKQRLEDEQNRIASPEFYGRAAYEDRRASDRNTPNVRLSSSLLQELQLQYSMSPDCRAALNNYATESSVGSMSFRPGSPAGSARHARQGWQSATPTSTSLQNGSIGGLQFFRRRKKSPTRYDRGGSTSPSQALHQVNFSSAPRNRQEDLESTSDDFEDVSLHNGPAHPRLEQLREFLLKQEQQTVGRLSPTTGLENVNGFDQISLHGTSPVFLDRQVSARASAASVSPVGLGGGWAAAGTGASPYSQSVAPYPLHHSTMVAGLPTLNASFHSYQSWCSASVNSPVVGLAGSPSYPHVGSTSPLSGTHPGAEEAGASARTGVKPPHPVLSPRKAPASTRHQTSLSSAVHGSGSNAAVQACHVGTFSPPSNRCSSGLRSPFSLPGSDPVTASCSASSGGARAQT